MLAPVPALDFNRPAFEAAFRDFLDHVTIDSKDYGYIPFKLYDLPWAPGRGAQEYGLTQILDGLEADIHYFVFLKARQLGWTTLSILFDLFWCGMYPGLQGAIVTDTDPNKEKLRLLIGGDTSQKDDAGHGILDLLPETHRLGVVRHNRNGLAFKNGSMLDYLVAGTKKRTGSLGRSRAYNFCHVTEAAQFGDEEGFESLVSSFSKRFPARFYNIESTPRGYNLFYNEWEEARTDTITKKAVLLAWWQHPEYMYERGSALFERYGHEQFSDEEKETAAIVRRDFDYEITIEQWAWYRHRSDPRRRAETEDRDADKIEIVQVEYPSYPEQAFRSTGSPFFRGRQLDDAIRRAEAQRIRAYWYKFGETFTDLRRNSVNNARLAQLKIWHEPHPNGLYVISFDPSYGRGKDSDRHAIEVYRCYADRLVQCAEFCVAQLPPFQATWVLVDLAGWYNFARIIIEIDGPGEACLGEFRHLRTLLDTGKLNPPPGESDVTDEEAEKAEFKRYRSPLRNVREYFYRRPDVMSSTYLYQWKSNQQNKETIMVNLHDQFLMGHLVVNSVALLYEMRRLVRTEGSIEAEGTFKDDRAVASALGVKCWLDWERRELDASGRTFERETAQDEAMGDAGDVSMVGYVMMQRAQQKRAQQRAARQATRQTNWAW